MTSRRALLAATVLVAAASVYVNAVLTRAEVRAPREPLSAFPKSIGQWTSVDFGISGNVLSKLGADEYIMRRFSDGRNEIVLYIGYYKSQAEGSIPHSPRRCYPGNGFNPLRNDLVTIPVEYPGKREIRPNRYVFGKGLDREVVIYWYQSRGRTISNEYWEKLYLVRDAILRRRSDGALVRFSMSATSGKEDAAMRRLEEFISMAYPHIPRVVPD